MSVLSRSHCLTPGLLLALILVCSHARGTNKDSSSMAMDAAPLHLNVPMRDYNQNSAQSLHSPGINGNGSKHKGEEESAPFFRAKSNYMEPDPAFLEVASSQTLPSSHRVRHAMRKLGVGGLEVSIMERLLDANFDFGAQKEVKNGGKINQFQKHIGFLKEGIAPVTERRQFPPRNVLQSLPEDENFLPEHYQLAPENVGPLVNRHQLPPEFPRDNLQQNQLIKSNLGGYHSSPEVHHLASGRAVEAAGSSNGARDSPSPVSENDFEDWNSFHQKSHSSSKAAHPDQHVLPPPTTAVGISQDSTRAICYKTDDILIVIALTCCLNFAFVLVIWGCVRWFNSNSKDFQHLDCEEGTPLFHEDCCNQFYHPEFEPLNPAFPDDEESVECEKSSRPLSYVFLSLLSSQSLLDKEGLLRWRDSAKPSDEFHFSRQKLYQRNLKEFGLRKDAAVAGENDDDLEPTDSGTRDLGRKERRSVQSFQDDALYSEERRKSGNGEKKLYSVSMEDLRYIYA